MLQDLKDQLASIANLQGEVMYSPASALRPGKLYLLGFNPGTGGPATTIGEHLAESAQRTDNAWLDENWRGNLPSLLQKRIRELFEKAGLDLMNTPSSNLIFATSNDASCIEYSLAHTCWPVHEAVLDIVKPTTLLVFGNGDESPYAFLRNKFGGQHEQHTHYATFSLKRLTTKLCGRHTTVIGLPHPSRCKIPKLAVEWLKLV